MAHTWLYTCTYAFVSTLRPEVVRAAEIWENAAGRHQLAGTTPDRTRLGIRRGPREDRRDAAEEPHWTWLDAARGSEESTRAAPDCTAWGAGARAGATRAPLDGHCASFSEHTVNTQ